MDTLPIEVLDKVVNYLSRKDVPLVLETFKTDVKKKGFLQLLVKKCIRLHKATLFHRDCSYIILIQLIYYKQILYIYTGCIQKSQNNYFLGGCVKVFFFKF